MIAGLAVQIALIFLVMIKATIKLRYSLSLAATLPVLVFIVLKILETSAWKVEKLQIPFYGLILIGVVFSLTSQKPIIDERHRVEGIIQNAKDQAVNQLAKRMNMEEEDIVVVNAYAVPLKCAGLLQGSNWTGNFEAELLNICPNQHAVWDTIVDLNTAVPVKNISDIEWDMVIWPGNGSNLPEYLNAVGAVNVPRSWHVEYSKWFFIRPEFAEK
ncbi:MAG TPA: hypothetical protein DCX53_04560 [Anaerolineae bacterium]|nr:hypothetical protein [Anaerolineae bacterium]